MGQDRRRNILVGDSQCLSGPICNTPSDYSSGGSTRDDSCSDTHSIRSSRKRGSGWLPSHRKPQVPKLDMPPPIGPPPAANILPDIAPGALDDEDTFVRKKQIHSCAFAAHVTKEMHTEFMHWLWSGCPPQS